MSDARAIHLWLPAKNRFDQTHPIQPVIARADGAPDGARGYIGGLESWFPMPGGLPSAALTRELLCGDAEGASWLSADPAWVQPDMNGARLLACGQMGLDRTEADALARPLKPVFGDYGMLLEVSSPDRWHVRLPRESRIPQFAPPEQALGEDLFEHLPQGDDARRWRVLLNEVQVILHQHPANTTRREQGLPPVNSLWLWGGGALPSHVRTVLAHVVGDDVLLGALARRAGIATSERTKENIAAATPGTLVDLQDLPGADIGAAWWTSLERVLQKHPVELAFASGERYQHQPWHRWRFWRKTRA